jgi:hypothetical protein
MVTWRLTPALRGAPFFLDGGTRISNKRRTRMFPCGAVVYLFPLINGFKDHHALNYEEVRSNLDHLLCLS